MLSKRNLLAESQHSKLQKNGQKKSIKKIELIHRTKNWTRNRTYDIRTQTSDIGHQM